MNSQVASSPVVIAVAPNGARSQKSDHPALPLTPSELAKTAVDCVAAGATMLHLHVRDNHGRHTLDPRFYQPALAAIKDVVGDALIIQVTSEAAGIYTPVEQMQWMGELAPECVSIAICELFADERDIEIAANFLESLNIAGTRMQFILYDLNDVNRYYALQKEGVIPINQRLVLCVLGRYAETDVSTATLDDFVQALHKETVWMACAFGRRSHQVLTAAAQKGGHVRIGFENGWQMPDGEVAQDNAALVRTIAGQITEAGLTLATASDAHSLFKI